MLNELPLTDRPEDHVLKDDEKCDRWWDGYTKQIEHEANQMAREQAKRRSGAGGAGFEAPTFDG